MVNLEDSVNPLVSQIVELAQLNPEIQLLWLYGSRGNNTASSTSDYDLAIAFKTRLKDPVERRFRPELLTLDWQQALGIGDNILSIVDINQAPSHWLSTLSVRTQNY